MKNWVRRWWALAVGVIAFSLAAWFTPGLWLKFDGWVQNQRDLVWERFESMVGQKVVYDRIAPNVLAALDFQNVRLLADDGSAVATAASIRLSLDWQSLFEGKISEALRRVQVINATVNLDQRRDKALIDHWASFIRPGKTTAFGYEVEGFNLTARWTDGTRSASLDRGFVVLTPEGGQWGLRFRGAVAWDDRSAGHPWASLSVRGDLRSDAGFENWSLRTEATAVKTSWFDLEPLTLQIGFSPQQVTVAKVADRVPLDLQAVWDRGTNLWSFKGAAENFRPSQLLHLKSQELWAGFSQGTLTGRFSYQINGDFSFDGRGEWPAGAWPSPFDASAVTAVGSVRTEGDHYRFEGFHLEASTLALGFSGTLDKGFSIPEGTLELQRLVIPGVGEAHGTLDLSASGSRIVFVSHKAGWNDLGSDGAEGWLEQGGTSWNFQIEGPVDGTAAGRFSASGVFDPAVPRFETRVEFNAVPLAKAEAEIRLHAPVFEWPKEIRPLVGDVEGHVIWTTLGWEVPETRFDLTDPGQTARHLQGSLSWKERSLDVNLKTVAWDGVNSAFHFGAVFEDGPVEMSAEGRILDRDVALKARWVPLDRSLVFNGTPGISGVLHQNDAGVWTAQFSLAPLEVVPGFTFGINGNAVLDGPRWTLNADRIEVMGTYPWNHEPFSVSSSLLASPEFLRFEGVNLEDSHGKLAGTAVSSWSVDWSQPWAGRLALATPETGREAIMIDWVGTSADRWHFGVKVGGLDVARIPGTFVQGRLALTGSGEWKGGRDVVWNVQTALSEARWGDSPLGFRASLSGTDKKLAIRNANLSVNSLRITDGTADVDAALRTWKAGLGMGLRIGTGDWLSRWTVEGTWSGDDQLLHADFSLRTQANTWSRRSFPDTSLTGRWGHDGWEVSFSDGGLTARGQSDGSFSLRAQAPFPIKADAEGTWSVSSFSVAVKGFHADLGLVKEFVNSPMFSVGKGEVSGDFSLGGAPADPEANGQLLLHGVTMGSSFVRQPLGPVDVKVTLEGHQVVIPPVNVGPPGQTWIVAGLARLDHLLPEEFQFTLQTDALSVIPVSYQYTGLSATGGVSGLLVVKGTPVAVTLGGRLVLQDTTITLKQSQPSAAGLGFNADLTLVTGRKVEFLWPNESLPLLRAVTASNQTLVIKANDVASTWSVNGKLAIKTGEINYLNRTFVVKEGELGFQESQTGFDPRIAVRAEWKVRETTGNIIINLRADGTLSKFSPRFDAVPYQSPEQLQQLVGSTLALPSDYSKSTNMDTALSLASDVTTSFLLTPFEETVKKNFQLDLFTVKTEVLKKTLLGRNGPLEASDYLDNTRLFFGKYIGDDLFLQGTLAFRRDSSVATQVSPKMVVEPEFQMEFQTPFFLLNWTLLPLHPETLFVTDNTVTFRWNWSY